jgi:hypothetical protein
MCEQYKKLETECERLVTLLDEHGVLTNLLAINSDLCHPDTFRAHGEYGVWVESVYDMLVEHDLQIAPPILAQIQSLADQMHIRGQRIP